MVYNRELDNTSLSEKIERGGGGGGQKQMPLNNFSASHLGIKIHKLKHELHVRTEQQHGFCFCNKFFNATAALIRKP